MLIRGITILNIILAAMLSYSVVQFLLSFNQAPSVKTHTQSTTLADSDASFKTDSLDISDLLNSQLFGQTKVAELPVTAEMMQPLDTQLNLKLHGIFFTPDGHGEFESWAMITQPDGKSGIYNENSALSMNGNLPLPAGAVLHKIYEKYVVLSRNGRYESLRFDENDSSNNYFPDHSQNESITISQENPSQLLGQFQQQLRTKPESLMRLVRIFPVSESGKFIGYRLKPGHDKNIMSQFGLESGDIVTAVNDVTLDSPLKGLGLIQQLATADRVDLQVLRDDQALSLSFAIAQQ